MPSADKKTVLDDQNFNSDRLSTQVRLIALGLLAVVWALLVSTQVPIQVDRRGLIIVACLAILAMLLDLAQYAVGYQASKSLYDALEHGEDRGYSKTSLAYRARTFFFWAKQAAVILAGLTFLAVTIPRLV
jgi:hypothetical protein